MKERRFRRHSEENKTMAKDRLIRIAHGSFGRVTLHLIQGPLVAHAHAEFHLVFKLGGADATFKADGELMTLTDDTALMINPWITHAKPENSDEPSLLLALLLEPSWLGSTLGIANAATGLRFRQRLGSIGEEASTVIEALATLLAQYAPDSDMTDCETLIARLVRAVGESHLQQRNLTEVLASSRPLDFRVKRAADYIRQHASDNPNIEQIASAVGMSRSRLFDQFKACMGVSPQQYLDWVRLTIATRLLAEPRQTIGDVSHQLGFSAQSHFTRFFVQHLGLSPTEFRRNGTLAGVGLD
jgi:AraC-like DNA-binding protein